MGELFTRKSGATTVNIERYNNVADMAADCDRRQITDSRFHDMRTYDLKTDFHGVRSYNKALDYLRNGYTPAVEELKADIKVSQTGAQRRTRVRNNVTGFAPVVPLALMGVPNAMLDKKITKIKNKVIDIYYDEAYSASTSSEEIIANGKHILSAIIKLEAQGYATNIYCVTNHADSNDRPRTCDMCVVKAKDSKQPLDLTKLSFILTHTAFFRCIGWDWYSKTPHAKYRGGYGVPISYTYKDDRLRQFGHDLFGENAVYIAGREILEKGADEIKQMLLDNSGNK